MKKIFFLLAFSYLLLINFCYSQWVLNYSDTTFYFMDVQFTSANTGWVAGYKVLPNIQTEGRLLKTTNGGVNWNSLNIGTIPGLWDVCFLNDDTGWIIGDKGTVRKTTNGGLNWIQQITDLSDHNKAFFLNPDTGWVTGLNTFATTNGGNNWLQMSNTLLSSYAVNFLNANTGFITTYYSLIHKTTNGGVNWQRVFEGAFHTYIYEIFFINDLTGWAVGDNNGVQKTTNCGDNWMVLNYPDDSKTVYFKDVNTGWLGGYGVMFKTTNSGIDWVLQSLPVSFMGYIYGLSKSNDSTLWAAGGTGYLFKTTNGGVGIEQISTEVPNEYKLWQNYPNPFNPSTVIRFSLSVVSLSTLKIFDITGKEVATLVNEKLAPGTYSIEWNAAGYPSGVYFYQMSAGDFRETRRMILTK